MIKEHSDKLDKKIREYLKKQFPKKTLTLHDGKFVDKSAEVYGFNGIQIKVIELDDEVVYQVIKKSI